MDSTAETAPREAEIINELLSRVTRGLHSTGNPLGVINHQRTAVAGDAWIRQPRQPLDSQKSLMKLLSWVTRGFDSPHMPYGVKNHQRIAVTGDALIRQATQVHGVINRQRTSVTGDAWIRQRRQPLGSHKSTTNCCHV